MPKTRFRKEHLCSQKIAAGHLNNLNISGRVLKRTLKEPIMFSLNFKMCSSRKYPYSPHRRDWKFRVGGGGGEVSKTQKFKAMYEVKLEFPEWWGVIGQIPSVGGGGGMDIFWSHTI